jgi:hypothetical protein
LETPVATLAAFVGRGADDLTSSDISLAFRAVFFTAKALPSSDGEDKGGIAASTFKEFAEEYGSMQPT